MGFEVDEGRISGSDPKYLDKPLPVYRTYIGRISCYFEFIYNEYLKLLCFVKRCKNFQN